MKIGANWYPFEAQADLNAYRIVEIGT